MAFQPDGTLTTDKRTIDDAETWDTQTDWEAYQSKSNITITNGALSLAETNVIDNFELASASPSGPYGDSETLADYYNGATSNWSLTTNQALVDSRSVSWNALQSAIWSHSGLIQYPTETDSLSFLLRTKQANNSISDTVAGFLSNVENVTAPQAYVYDISSNLGIRIGIATYDSDGIRTAYTNFTENAVSISDQTTYYCEVSPPSSGDNTITFDVYNWSGTVGSLVGTDSTTDSQLVGETGIGWAQQRNLDGTQTAVSDTPNGDQLEIV